MKAFVALCMLLFITGCGDKGLDRKIDWSNTEKLAEGCVNSYVEMKDANPKEYEAMKAAGRYVIDVSQPREQAMFADMMGNYCNPGYFTVVHTTAAVDNNIRLDQVVKTFRDFRIWELKNEMDSASKPITPSGTVLPPDTSDLIKQRFADHDKEEARKNAEVVAKYLPVYLALTGKPYVPPTTK